MNCGKTIPIADVEQHSISCTKVNEELLKLESNQYEVYSIHFKIKRLIEYLQSLNKISFIQLITIHRKAVIVKKFTAFRRS